MHKDPGSNPGGGNFPSSEAALQVSLCLSFSVPFTP